MTCNCGVTKTIISTNALLLPEKAELSPRFQDLCKQLLFPYLPSKLSTLKIQCQAMYANVNIFNCSWDNYDHLNISPRKWKYIEENHAVCS